MLLCTVMSPSRVSTSSFHFTDARCLSAQMPGLFISDAFPVSVRRLL